MCSALPWVCETRAYNSHACTLLGMVQIINITDGSNQLGSISRSWRSQDHTPTSGTQVPGKRRRRIQCSYQVNLGNMKHQALVILYHPDHHHQQPSARLPAGRRAKATALSSRCRGDIWVVTCRMYRLKKIKGLVLCVRGWRWWWWWWWWWW